MYLCAHTCVYEQNKKLFVASLLIIIFPSWKQSSKSGTFWYLNYWVVFNKLKNTLESGCQGQETACNLRVWTSLIRSSHSATWKVVWKTPVTYWYSIVYQIVLTTIQLWWILVKLQWIHGVYKSNSTLPFHSKPFCLKTCLAAEFFLCRIKCKATLNKTP